MASVEVTRCKESDHGWRVERIDEDGGMEATVFFGNNPQARAKAYARLLEF